MKFYFTVFSFIVLLFACQPVLIEKEAPKIYSHWIGDILFDAQLDESDFQLCDSTKIVHRRNALSYEKGKQVFKEICLDRFQFQPEFAEFTGYIMIRFLINCNGQTGRFRAESLAPDFSLREAPEGLTNHLLEISRGLKRWNRNRVADENADCSKYLNFKIKNGKIENILH